MRKEFDIEDLIGFEIKWYKLEVYNHFLVNNDSIISTYKKSSDETIIKWVDNHLNLSNKLFIIRGDYLYYSDKEMSITNEFLEKLESYYTYNKRKKLLKELGI